MAKVLIKIYERGVGEALKAEPMQRAVGIVANGIADAVRGQISPDAPVTVTPYITDRAACAVTIADVRGLIYQARDGVLTRAAAELGYEVTEDVRL
ncbi:MAG: hypothetical protein J2P17_16870 [Mycobacterium sp.]|nr:hypothetical protein [Mycobacterium sp.]